MENNGRETFIETLNQSCNIGTYSTLQEEDYNFTCKAKTDCTLMLLKFETLDKYRNKYDELNYYLIEYEGFIEDNGAPFCDFLMFRNKKEKFDPRKTLKNGIKRAKHILKSFSRKIEFGDILKRVHETIRRERAEEKKKKKKKHNDDNKPLTQTQANGKMIQELKDEIKKMKELMENLVGVQQTPVKELQPDSGDNDFEESHLSSLAIIDNNDNVDTNNQNQNLMTHNHTLNNTMGNQMQKNSYDFQKSVTHSQNPMGEEWD